MFKKIVGKLKVTSENILDYLLYKKNSLTGEQYKNFNVEILVTPLSRKKFYDLCEMDDSQDEIISQKRGRLFGKISAEIMKKLVKEIREDILMEGEKTAQGIKDKIFEKRLSEIDTQSKKEHKISGLLLQGYTRINDCFFYTVGVSHGYGYYKFFAFNGSEKLSFTITGKDLDAAGKLKNNTLLSSFSLNDNAYNENYVCGIGALKEIDKEESAFFVEENMFGKQEPVNVFLNDFKTLKNMLKSEDFFAIFYDAVEESINTNTYKVYEAKEKVNILPILKKYEEKITKEIKDKYGICYFSEATYEDKNTGRREDFCEDLIKIIEKNVDDAIKNFPTRLNYDAKELVKQSFIKIYIDNYYNYEDIGTSYLLQILDNYDFFNTVCKEDIFKLYTDTMLEHLKGVETIAKDVLCAFKDSEIFWTFSSQDENAKSEDESINPFEKESFINAFSKAHRVKFLKDNLKRMKFDDEQIKKLVVDFYTFEALQDDVVEELATKDLKNGKDIKAEDYIIKSSEYVYKKIMIECSKMIVGKMKKYKRKEFLHGEDKSFVTLSNIGENNPKTKETPSTVESEKSRGFD